MEYKNILNQINKNEEYDINEMISERPNDSLYIDKSLLAYLYDLQLDGKDDEDLQQLIDELEKRNAICTEYSEHDLGDIDLDEEGERIYVTHFTYVRNKNEFLQSRAIKAIQRGDLEKLDRIIKQGLNLNENLAEYESYKEEYFDRTEINEEKNHEVREIRMHPLFYVFNVYPGPTVQQRVDMIKYLTERCNNINSEDIKFIKDVFEDNPNCKSEKVLQEALEEALAKIEEKAKRQDDKHTPSEIAEGIEPTKTGMDNVTEEMVAEQDKKTNPNHGKDEKPGEEPGDN